jgi:hypothetical protein
MIPAIGFIAAAPFAKYALILQLIGWNIIGASLVLYIVPRFLHPNFAATCVGVMKPLCVPFILPFALAIGIFILLVAC